MFSKCEAIVRGTEADHYRFHLHMLDTIRTGSRAWVSSEKKATKRDCHRPVQAFPLLWVVNACTMFAKFDPKQRNKTDHQHSTQQITNLH